MSHDSQFCKQVYMAAEGKQLRRAVVEGSCGSLPESSTSSNPEELEAEIDTGLKELVVVSGRLLTLVLLKPMKALTQLHPPES